MINFTKKIHVRNVFPKIYFESLKSILVIEKNNVDYLGMRLTFSRIRLLRDSVSGSGSTRRTQYRGSVSILDDNKTIVLKINFLLELVLAAIVCFLAAVLLLFIRPEIKLAPMVIVYFSVVSLWYGFSVYYTLLKFSNFLIQPFDENHKL
ncbi:MAG: hypothetical protein WC044_03265 [Crocinitomicaceae bacterium]